MAGPRVKFTSGNDLYEIDASELGEAKKQFPDLKISEPTQTQPSLMDFRNRALGLNRVSQQVPGPYELVNRLKQKTEELAPALAQRGVPPYLAAGITTIPRVAEEALPTSNLETALLLGGGEIAARASPALKAAGKVALEEAPRLLSALSGLPEVVHRLHLQSMVDLFNKDLIGPEEIEKVISGFQKTLKNARQYLGRRIGRTADMIDQQSGNVPVLDLPKLRDIATGALTRKGGFQSPLLPGVLKALTPPVNPEARFANFGVAHAIRKELQELVTYGLEDPTGQRIIPVGEEAPAKVKGLINLINRRIYSAAKKVSPGSGFSEMNGQFSDLAGAMTQLEKEFLSAKNPDEKLISIFNKDSTSLRRLRKISSDLPSFLNFMDQAEKAYVTNQLAPRFRRLPPTGITTIPAAIGGAVGSSVAGTPGFVVGGAAAIPAAMALFSPRAVGGTSRAAVSGIRALFPAVEAGINSIQNPVLRAVILSKLRGEPQGGQ